MLITTHYPEEHYSTLFNSKTGFFARVEDKGFPEPQWSYHGPELLDIAITGWCDGGCDICYRNATKTGRHMAEMDYRSVMEQAATMGVMQVALGGGNPNQHPRFAEILRLTREEYGIVPSYTTNGRGLTDEILTASKKYCGAVAVSMHNRLDETDVAVRKMLGYGIRTNIHFVLDGKNADIATQWLRNPPAFLSGINALVFLNYKPVGRSKGDATLLRESGGLDEFFNAVTEAQYSFRLGFDSCLVSGLVSYTDIDSAYFDACDAGRFSMFVSEDLLMYPCSFMVEDYAGIPISKDNMLPTWRNGDLFQNVRQKLLSGRCSDCDHSMICKGGCPIYENINLCGKGRVKRKA